MEMRERECREASIEWKQQWQAQTQRDRAPHLPPPSAKAQIHRVVPQVHRAVLCKQPLYGCRLVCKGHQRRHQPVVRKAPAHDGLRAQPLTLGAKQRQATVIVLQRSDSPDASPVRGGAGQVRPMRVVQCPGVRKKRVVVERGEPLQALCVALPQGTGADAQGVAGLRGVGVGAKTERTGDGEAAVPAWGRAGGLGGDLRAAWLILYEACLMIRRGTGPEDVAAHVARGAALCAPEALAVPVGTAGMHCLSLDLLATILAPAKGPPWAGVGGRPLDASNPTIPKPSLQALCPVPFSGCSLGWGRGV